MDCLRVLFPPALLVCLGLIAAAQPPATKVKIGYSGPLKDIDAVKAAGFDFMEIRTAEIAALSDAGFDELAARFQEIGLAVPAAYHFLPADLKVTGPNIDKLRQKEYLERAFPRLTRLGVKIVVFGSSGARQVPEGFPKREAFAQLVDFGKRVGPIARRYGIEVAIEPQRRQESNIVNNADEALQWVEAVNHPNIQLMIDYYHFEVEKEAPAVLLSVSKHIRHLHMANPDKRVMPLKRDEYNYGPFFAMLRRIGYNRLIGLEASSSDLVAEGPQTIALLRRLFAE